jgi:hypothetical protein
MDRPNPARPQAPKIRINAPQTAARPAPRAPLDPAFAPAPPPRQAAPAPRAPVARPGPRPVVQTGAGFFTKAFIWLLLLSLGALVGGAYFLKGDDGQPFATTFLAHAKVKIGMEKPKPPPPPPPMLEDDPKYKEIKATRESARTFLDGASNPAGDLGPDVAAGLEKQIDALARNGEELGALSAKYPGTGPEVATHAKLQRDLASALATVKVALEKVAVAKAAEAAKKALPVVVDYDLNKLNPWAGRAANSWVRWKKTAGKTVTYEDEVLQSIGDAGAIVAVTGFAGDAPFRLADREIAGGKGKVAREETVKIGDAEVTCVVVESNGTAYWIPKAGRWADRLAVKGPNAAVSAIGEEEIPVKGEPKKCARFERNGLAYWGLEDVPGFLVRVQGDGIVSEVVDWGAGDRPEFPRPPKPPEVAAETIEAFRRANAWSAAKPGMWTRRKADYVSPLATSETASDATLIEVDDAHVTLKVETLGLDGQVKSGEQKIAYALPGSKVAGEETLTIGATAYPCVILETPTEKTWIAKGPLPAVLKAESMSSTRTATALEETQLRVGRHVVKCLHVTSEGRRDDNALKEEVWLSDEVPGFEVRREAVQQTSVGAARSTTMLVDFGDIPARKTAIGFQKEDPARLEEQRVLKVIDDTEDLVIGASATFREVVTASRELPSEPPKLRELLQRCDEVSAQLGKAKETYGSVRERAPQAAGVDEKLSKIDRALAALAKIRESVQQRLK